MPEQPRSERRPDIVLYLNGPVVVVAACRGTWAAALAADLIGRHGPSPRWARRKARGPER